MIEITRILGHCDDADLSTQIHHVGHHGHVEYLHIPPAEAARIDARVEAWRRQLGPQD